ncbi:MAG: hypothetical protein IKC89_03190 [Lentisphaeria bacterium]|nr:hypothetical protein [Lentisphaeria bacterium]
MKGFMGEGKNFFSREKSFFPSPKPSPLFKKSGVFCCSRWSQRNRKRNDETVELTSSSINVKGFMEEGKNFFSREKKFPLSPAPPFSFKKSGVFCCSRWSQRNRKRNDEIVELTSSSINVKGFMGEGEKRFSPSPKPSPLFKKSGGFLCIVQDDVFTLFPGYFFTLDFSAFMTCLQCGQLNNT